MKHTDEINNLKVLKESFDDKAQIAEDAVNAYREISEKLEEAIYVLETEIDDE